MSASWRPLRTAMNSSGRVRISYPPESVITSSAPASRAAKITWSSSYSSLSTRMTPFLSNNQATEPSVPSLPPLLSKIWRTSAAARFLLSVKAVTYTATPEGPYPSYVSWIMSAPSPSSPVPYFTGRSILSLGMFASLAVWIAWARVAFMSGSPPPSRAATVMARESLEKSFPRFLSWAAFLCLIPAHLECPDMPHTSCLSLTTPAPSRVLFARLTTSRKYRWTFLSPVNSGWNATATRSPCCTAIALPPNRDRTLTSFPRSSTQGARMNTPRIVSRSPCRQGRNLSLCPPQNCSPAARTRYDERWHQSHPAMSVSSLRWLWITSPYLRRFLEQACVYRNPSTHQPNRRPP